MCGYIITLCDSYRTNLTCYSVWFYYCAIGNNIKQQDSGNLLIMRCARHSPPPYYETIKSDDVYETQVYFFNINK